jgi:hypothetical protein
MGQVTAIRAATGSPPPEQRTPEREKLAREIARVAEASAELDRVRQAMTKTGEPWARDGVVERAEAALLEARERAPAQLVADILQGGRRSDVARAEAALQVAREEATSQRATARLLAAEERQAIEKLQRATGWRQLAVTEVLKTDLAVAALLAQYKAAKLRVEDLTWALREVSLGLPYAWDVPRVDEMADRGAGQPWREAVAMLALDADAPLPGPPDV